MACVMLACDAKATVMAARHLYSIMVLVVQLWSADTDVYDVAWTSWPLSQAELCRVQPMAVVHECNGHCPFIDMVVGSALSSG